MDLWTLNGKSIVKGVLLATVTALPNAIDLIATWLIPIDGYSRYRQYHHSWSFSLIASG